MAEWKRLYNASYRMTLPLSGILAVSYACLHISHHARPTAKTQVKSWLSITPKRHPLSRTWLQSGPWLGVSKLLVEWPIGSSGVLLTGVLCWSRQLSGTRIYQTRTTMTTTTNELSWDLVNVHVKFGRYDLVLVDTGVLAVVCDEKTWWGGHQIATERVRTTSELLARLQWN